MGAPERSCVACRSKSGKQDFIRFVVSSEGDVLVDSLHLSGKGGLSGRGAYLHLACATKQAQGKLIYSLGKNRKLNMFDLVKLVEDFKSTVEVEAKTRKKLRFL